MTDDLHSVIKGVKGVWARLPYLPRALGLVWAAASKWTVLWVVLLVVQGLLPAATVTLTRRLVDDLAAVVGIGGSWQTLRPTLALAALMGGLLLLTEVLSSISGWIRSAQAELVQDHVVSLIQQQALALDLSFYDSADYYDHLYRARAEASYQPVSLLENVGALLQSSITLVAMLVILIPYGVWLPLALLASTVPALWVAVRFSLREHHWRHRTTGDERRAWYYDWLLTARDTAAELRLFELGDHFRAQYQAVRRGLRDQRMDLIRSRTLARAGAGLGSLLVTAAIVSWMGWQAWQGRFGLGDLALFYQAFRQGQGLMRSLLENISEIYGNTLFVGNLFEFLALKPQVLDSEQPAAPPRDLQEGIRFEQVSFRYPGSERLAVSNLGLDIPAGQIVSIVGANGAGKSTLIRLLCRFYDPESGSITWDGTDLRTLEIAELRRQITVLFQEPVRYHATAAQNIAYGDLGTEHRFEEIEAVAQAAGADGPIGRLPSGYDTPLGRWFEGSIDLSVGEWQRIALARAFLRRTPLIILDEPTSSMDSWAEVDWLRRFQCLASGRTAVIITHRFTTAMHADQILVMENGTIVESGSHLELLALGGRYAESWEAQMQGLAVRTESKAA